MERFINKIVKAALKDFETPFYLYDKSKLLNTIKRIKNSLPKNSSIFFASMANDNIKLWEILNNNNVKLFATSISHIKSALNIGFNSNDIIFSKPSLSSEDFIFLNDNKIKYILNSVEQVKQCIKYKNKNEQIKVGIRLNINDFNENGASAYLGLNSRFGIFKEDFDEVKNLCHSKNITINGLQIYIGTNIMFQPRLLAFYENLFQFSKELDSLEYLDLGGGFGIPYKYPQKKDFDWESFSNKFMNLTERFSYLKKINLFFEPGRSMIARSGYFITKVTDIIKRNDKNFIITDSSVSIFPRPHIYPDAFHFVSIVSKSGILNRKKIFADIYGCTIYSKDILANNIKINLPNVGDYLVFHDAGAYCYSMRSYFLGVTFPKQLLLMNESIVEI